MKKRAIVLLTVMLLFGIAYQVKQMMQAPQAIPALNFTSIDGEIFTPQSLQGHPVLITFWSTDCPSCVRDMDHLIALHQRYNHLGLKIIAFSMAYDPPNHVVNMVKERQLPYTVVLDFQGEYANAFGGVMLTPNTFLIAPDGQLALHQLGVLNQNQFESIIDQWLISKNKQ